VQTRDPKPARPSGAGSGPNARAQSGARGAAPQGYPGARPVGYISLGRATDPRFARPRGAVGKVSPGVAPRPPIFTHREPQVGPGPRYPGLPAARSGFGLPNLRRNVCPHFYMTGSRGAIPIQAPHLLKALIRQEQNISRCQLRGGVHLEQGYVNDVCLTPRFNQCVFYEDDLSKD
jgi:hypothetical protein